MGWREDRRWRPGGLIALLTRIAVPTWITTTAPEAARQPPGGYANAAAASGFKQPAVNIQVRAQRIPPGPPPSVSPHLPGGAGVCT
jgi:hypothetical protein